MGYIKDFLFDVKDLDEQGFSPQQIADWFEIPLSMVEDAFIAINDLDEEQQQDDDFQDCDEPYNEDMDGDFDSAMASAGFGTDEDYGCYGDEGDF